MQTVKLLQIGDVHYPELLKDFPVSDIKDRGYPRGVLNITVPSDTRVMLARSIRDVANDPSIAAVLVCGDLTTGGRLDPYEECRKWLRDACGLGDLTRWPQDRVHVVPGNHDIDRTLCSPDELDTTKKFEQIEAAWQADGNELTVRRLRTTRMEVSAFEAVEVHSMNSCLGCHEFRELPAAIVAALKTVPPTAGPTDPLLEYERLDSPAFDRDTIDELETLIRSGDERTVPVVLAHHNLLPQGLPRIALYTELINGGYFRRTIGDCGKGVLYLHGHIHEDSVEIVTPASSEDPRGFIVSISAPRLGEGFNVVGIVFGHTHQPIGCIVTPYRRKPSGNILPSTPIRIPLVRNLEQAIGIASEDPEMTRILRKAGRNDIRLSELSEKLASNPIASEVLIERLREAEFLGLAAISGPSNQPREWIVRGASL
jgi:3',5'-cyclic AMP phosphodiesterase CpdA